MPPVATASVILAAGKGSRMKSRLPKVVHPVCGKPMLGIIADACAAAGFDRVVIVVPGESSRIRDAMSDGFSYAVQDEQLGSGHALLKARDAAGDCDNLLVVCGDTPLIRSETLSSLMAVHVRSEVPMTVLTAKVDSPDGLGRMVRDEKGRVAAIVEHSQADAETLAITEINAGVYCFRAAWLWENLPALPPSSVGEIFLTDLAELAVNQGYEVGALTLEDPTEAAGVNTRVELAKAEAAMRERLLRRWMLEGVTIVDPASVYIDFDARIGMDSVILPNTHVRGKTVIGEGCEIGPNSVAVDSRVGDNCVISASVVEEAVLESDTRVGPFSHLRAGAYLESGVRIGNFGEIKNSRIGGGTKSGHFSYIGDAEVGSNVNIGAGSITCNFDGEHKHKTTIGDDAFIGCDTMMVAPVSIGDRSYTGVGSVVNRDVPADSGAIGAPARIRTRKPDAGRS